MHESVTVPAPDGKLQGQRVRTRQVREAKETHYESQRAVREMPEEGQRAARERPERDREWNKSGKRR